VARCRGRNKALILNLETPASDSFFFNSTTMIRTFKLLSIFLLTSVTVFAQDLIPKKGMVLKKSARIKKGTYALEGYDSLNRAVLVIEGNNIVIDFNGALFQGNGKGETPDRFSGLAAVVKKGEKITM